MNSAQCLFRELPYNSIEFIEVHGQFNNSLNNNLTTKQLQCLKSLHDLDVFSLNINTSVNPDHNLNYKPIQCSYYSPYGFSQQKSFLSSRSSFSLLHNNVRSLRRNLDNFQSHLLEELQLHFSVIGITETKITNSNFLQYLIIALNTYKHLYRLEVWVCIFTMTLIIQLLKEHVMKLSRVCGSKFRLQKNLLLFVELFIGSTIAQKNFSITLSKLLKNLVLLEDGFS